MRFRPLPVDEAAVRHFIEELWVPYHRELQTTVEGHGLADHTDLVDRELEYRLDLLSAEHHRTWLAVDDDTDADRSRESAFVEGDLAGFVTADLDESPPVFDRPDRLEVGDLYVREPYRGTGLARDLLDRTAKRARELECGELVLEVAVSNERAVAFYEGLGFETSRRRMTVAVDDL